VPSFPAEDTKLRATGVKWRLGGNVPNTLNVLAQVAGEDDRLVFLSAFAAKGASQRLIHALKEKKVEVIGPCRDACVENPHSWIFRSESSGTRTIVNYNGHLFPRQG
jgi:ketohexokinase